MRTQKLLSSAGLAVASVALAFAAAGCAAMGSNYERPKLEPPPLYRDAKPAPTPESVADVPW